MSGHAHGSAARGRALEGIDVERIVVPCVGIAILRFLLMVPDSAGIYADEWSVMLAGSVSRGLVPILVVAVLSCRKLTPTTLRRTGIPALLAICAGYIPALFGLDLSPHLCRAVSWAGIGWLYVCWAEVYAHIRIRDVAISMMLSMVASSLLSLAVSLLPQAITPLICCAGALVVFLLLVYYIDNDLPKKGDRAELIGTYGISALGENVKWVVCLLAFSFAMGVVRGTNVAGADEFFGIPSPVLYTGINIILAAILLASVLLRGHLLPLEACWILFFGATAAVYLPSLVWPEVPIPAATIFASFQYIALAFLNIKLVDVSHHVRVPQYVVFSFGWAVVNLFLVFGLTFAVMQSALSAISNEIQVAGVLGMLLITTLLMVGGSRLGDVHFDYSEENAKPQNRRACIFLLDSAA